MKLIQDEEEWETTMAVTKEKQRQVERGHRGCSPITEAQVNPMLLQ